MRSFTQGCTSNDPSRRLRIPSLMLTMSNSNPRAAAGFKGLPRRGEAGLYACGHKPVKQLFAAHRTARNPLSHGSRSRPARRSDADRATQPQVSDLRGLWITSGDLDDAAANSGLLHI